MEYKIIFLDCDGVINNSETTEMMPSGYLGADNKCLKSLKKIVDATSAIIVLSSDWRIDCEATKYLSKKLKKYGMRFVSTTPVAQSRSDRGWEINEWFIRNEDITPISWIVLDDEKFIDFEQYGILEHFIKTDEHNGGLNNKEIIEKAIELLNKEEEK